MKRNDLKIEISNEPLDGPRGWYCKNKLGVLCSGYFDLRWVNLHRELLVNVKLSNRGKIIGDE